MKQNRYDDPVFFEQYSQMARSQQGLAGAGEWLALRQMLPENLTGMRVLDLGCGYGWHCRYLMEQGAKRVLGIDLSHRMLERAAEINQLPGITYRQAAMEDLRFPPQSFHLIVSSLALHYTPDYRLMVRRMARWLRPGGQLVLSMEHPVFTAQGPQDWVYGPDGEIRHFPVDHYFSEGAREAVFLGQQVTKYHRTLTTCVNALLEAGLTLRQLVEPQPPTDMLSLPGMADELRRPMMLLLAAEKPL